MVRMCLQSIPGRIFRLPLYERKIGLGMKLVICQLNSEIFKGEFRNKIPNIISEFSIISEYSFENLWIRQLTYYTI